jgi:ArsR family transcriptional regulator
MEVMTFLAPLEPRELKPRAQEVARLLKALAHPDRLLLLCHLASGERSVTELSEFCETPQPVTSQALARLKREGWVACLRDGQQIFYRIEDPRIGKLLKTLKETFCHPAD